MLNRNAPDVQAGTKSSWQTELTLAETDPRRLLDYLGLGTDESDFDPAPPGFRMRVPWPFIHRMQPGDANDPLLLQVLPSARESDLVPGFSTDPVGDMAAETSSGVLQKYQGRALLIATGACAVHCRYCFRRHFPYQAATASADNWRPALAQIAADDTLSEVILSGGDPLSLNDARLGELVRKIQAIGHVQRLRIHTRLPVVLPQRVTDSLIATLAGGRLRTVVVVHVNHPNEIDAALEQALGRLRDAGITLLNQSVLLAGINDNVATLARLSERLFEAGVLPYYLHQLDRVTGAAHFEVGDDRARRLQRELRAQLPGYLVPEWVREMPGARSKTPL